MLAVLLAAIPFHSSKATTVQPVREVCPVCAHDFVLMEIASYTHFGCRERDFSDMPFAMFGRVKTCPHCLYAAVGSAFAAGTPKLHGELKALPQGLDKARVSKLKLPGDEEFLRLQIAEACLNWRVAGLKEQIDVQMRVYFASKRSSDAALLVAERARLLDLLDKALIAGTYSGGDEAFFTYLRGELLRLSGEETQALLQFIKTKALVSKLPPAKEDDGFKWLAAWSDEQMRRITFPKHGVEDLAALIGKGGVDRKIALVTLAGRNDPAAWRAIARYVMEDSERLIELESDVKLTREMMKIDAEFWRWGAAFYAASKEADQKKSASLPMTRFKNRFAYLFDDSRNTWNPRAEHAVELANELKQIAPNFTKAYTVEAGDTLSQISQRYGMPSFRMEELNPKIQNRDQIQAGQTLQRLALPAGWDEKQVLRHLPLAIKAGEPAAVAFFLQWAQTINADGIDEYSHEIRAVFEVLPNAPGLDAALKVPPSRDGARQLLRLSLRLIAGDAAAAEELVKLLKTHTVAPLGFTNDLWSVAARALVVCKNPALKAELIERMQPAERKKTPEELLATDAVRLNLEWVFAETIEALGTAEDVPRLEKMVQDLPLSATNDRDLNLIPRERVESSMLRLKLRLLAEASGK